MPYLRAPIYGITGNTGERGMTVSDKAEFWRVRQAIVGDETAMDALPERHVEVEMSEITGRTVGGRRSITVLKRWCVCLTRPSGHVK